MMHIYSIFVLRVGSVIEAELCPDSQAEMRNLIHGRSRVDLI